MSDSMKADFCITHFFNPVRFMRLLEIVETPTMNKDKMSGLRDFCKNELGKGIVNCNDTPGFIGNRIGVYAMQVQCMSFRTRSSSRNCRCFIWPTIRNS